jgi:phosphoribosylglycinamide formyltransferase 1
MKTRIAILASGSGTTAEKVIRSSLAGEVGYEVGLVICSRADAGIFARIAGLNGELGARIPCLLINHHTHPTKSHETVEKGAMTAAEEQAIITVLELGNFDLIVLLGYMKRVGSNIVKQFGWRSSYSNPTEARMLNTHPGLLPDTKGTYGIHAQAHTLEHGRKEAGQTLHVVAEDYDDGPIVAEHKITVQSSDTAEMLFDRVQAAEKQYIAQDIDNFIKQRQKGVTYHG